MSYFTCPHCDGPVDIFGRGASKRVCQQYDIEFLGEIPIDPWCASAATTASRQA